MPSKRFPKLDVDGSNPFARFFVNFLIYRRLAIFFCDLPVIFFKIRFFW